ncbi:aluminum-activated malate transporter 14-like isoform X2 [Arachis hypogaea]|uniref:aluminum-activated malate transporter 14-like isoform X2 n=1 Tax=Arachis hypogaea TaxID=3818 RepID=UPI0010FC6543|nr:aluminum-activated malate transporter 14-like isoform X2 [Arachis hypogaea]QHO25407.1 Aluminum-activated malate transporter [Arachis hypogaea]
MESTHVISITNNEEEKVVHNKEKNNNNKTFPFSPSFPTIISHVKEKKFNMSFVPIFPSFSHLSEQETKNMIHSIKVGISLVLVSLLYLLDPLYQQVGENAMWAIMTVVVIFEFSAGATLGKGLNRGMGTIVGGGLGCIAAILAQKLGGVGNSIIIGICIFIFVWEIARDRLLTIVIGFIICISVSCFLFPLWASNEFHDSTHSTFQQLANAIQGCVEDYMRFADEKENEAINSTNFTFCKTLLNSKSKDELLANYAKWEPLHGKFGYSYPWQNYLKIGEVNRDLAAIILVLGRCLQTSKKPMELQSWSETIQVIEPCFEAIGSNIVWSLKELGESMKQMRKIHASQISTKLKASRSEISMVVKMIISTSKKISTSMLNNNDENNNCYDDDDDASLATASFLFLLKEVVNKVEELTKVVEQLGDIAGFPTHIQL